MDLWTHNDLFWIIARSYYGNFQGWTFHAALDDEFADGPLDAPVR
jgi:hypothetical protein